MRIEINDDALKAEISRLIAASGGEKSLKKAAFTLTQKIKTNLGRGVTPWGEPFKPLASLTKNVRFRGEKRYARGATTAKFYRHMTGNHIPLNDTRQHIYNKITYVVNGKDAFVGLMDADSSKIARVHQFGAVITAKHAKYLAIPIGDGTFRFKRSVKIPARPFLPIRQNGVVELPEEWLDSIRDILVMDLKEN